MSTNRLYFVKTVEGENFGPVDQETLVKWAEGGKLKANDQIRSSLIAKWDKAVNLDFLKPLLLSEQEAEILRKKKSFAGKMIARMRLRAPELAGRTGLVDVKLDTMPSPEPLTRFLAILFDAILLLVVFVALFFGCYGLYQMGTLTEDNVAYVFVFSFFLITFSYFLITFGTLSQTLGQRYWGIFLIRSNGSPYWLGRIYFYVLFMFVFGILTPLAIATGSKSIQEILTGTRLVKVKTVKKR